MEMTGERQVSPTIDGIRADHVNRYRWASKKLQGQVYDIGCGIGYGSKVLSGANLEVVSFDISEEAINYANKYYSDDNILYKVADMSQELEFGDGDAAVCFEMIEHIEDPKPVLKSLSKSVKRLLVSVPNEKDFPYKGHLFHHRHYTKEEFENLLLECGWGISDWFGQEGVESPVHKGATGRTIIADCFPLKSNVPKHVAIIGLGPSSSQYIDIVKRNGGRHTLCDEVWGINNIGGFLQCDKIFHMDDVRIQEIRAAARPQSNIARMLEWLKTTETPVVTSRLHQDYPSLVEFPLEDVINNLTYDYFNSTAAYALAYAIHIGVQQVTLFGCDYTYPNAHSAEKGRACLEFWMGYGAAKGLKIGLPNRTSLMDATFDRQGRLYGYDTRVVTFEDRDGGGVDVVFKEVEELPTAEEIEDRYDHNKHPNVLVEEP